MRKMLSILFALALIMSIASFAMAQDQPSGTATVGDTTVNVNTGTTGTTQPAGTTTTTTAAPAAADDSRNLDVPEDQASKLEAAATREKNPDYDTRITRKTKWRIVKGYLVVRSNRGLQRFRPISGYYVAKPRKRGEGVIVQGRIYTNGRFLFTIPPDKNYNVWFYSRGFKIKKYVMRKTDLWDVFTVELEGGQRTISTIENLNEPTCNECGVEAPQSASEQIIINDNNSCYGRCSYYHKERSYDLRHYVIQFKFGSAVIENKFKAALDEGVKRMKEILADEKDTVNHMLTIAVRGHADEIGNDLVNNTIAYKRAAAIKAYLVKAGIDEARVKPISFGKTLPVNTCETECARSANRRVDFKFLWVAKCVRTTVEEIEEDDAPTFETPYTRLRDEEIDEWRDRPRYYREDDVLDQNYHRRRLEQPGAAETRPYYRTTRGSVIEGEEEQ